jgi:hypothetical protein
MFLNSNHTKQGQLLNYINSNYFDTSVFTGFLILARELFQ